MPAWRHIPRMTRTVIPAEAGQPAGASLSAYEAERAARIQRNNAMLAALAQHASSSPGR